MKDYIKGLITGALFAMLVAGPAHATYVPSVVRSLQYDSVTLDAATNTTTDTLATTLTNTSKAVLINLGCYSTDTNSIAQLARLTVTNTTTVTLTRGTSAASNTTCGYAVVEFY
jgi:hypothetical protein